MMASMKSCYKAEYRSKYNGEAVQFVPIDDKQESMESYESGFCSPPLRKDSRPGAPSQPLLSHNDYEGIPTNSRLQAIVRSQFELMQLVKSMPESSYELSLTDLVENPKPEKQVPEIPWGTDNDRDLRRRSRESKKNDRITRSASFEHKGMLLKMVFPVGLQSKRKKSLDKNVGGRAELMSKICGEREWWKKRCAASTDSDSSRTSGGGSGCSGRSQDSIRRRKGVIGNCCWPFFQPSGRESAE